jgi:hypothetical protein
MHYEVPYLKKTLKPFVISLGNSEKKIKYKNSDILYMINLFSSPMHP